MELGRLTRTGDEGRSVAVERRGSRSSEVGTRNKDRHVAAKGERAMLYVRLDV